MSSTPEHLPGDEARVEAVGDRVRAQRGRDQPRGRDLLAAHEGDDAPGDRADEGDGRPDDDAARAGLRPHGLSSPNGLLHRRRCPRAWAANVRQFSPARARSRRRPRPPGRGRGGSSFARIARDVGLDRRLAEHSSAAISAFDSPRATSASTSRSRAVSSASAAGGARAGRGLPGELLDQPPGDRRREQRVAGGDRRGSRASWSARRVLEQEPARPGAQRLEDVLVEVERREDRGPGRGPSAARIRRVASRPSITGIRTSISDHVGREPASRVDGLGAVGGLARRPRGRARASRSSRKPSARAPGRRRAGPGSPVARVAAAARGRGSRRRRAARPRARRRSSATRSRIPTSPWPAVPSRRAAAAVVGDLDVDRAAVAEHAHGGAAPGRRA